MATKRVRPAPGTAPDGATSSGHAATVTDGVGNEKDPVLLAPVGSFMDEKSAVVASASALTLNVSSGSASPIKVGSNRPSRLASGDAGSDGEGSVVRRMEPKRSSAPSVSPMRRSAAQPGTPKGKLGGLPSFRSTRLSARSLSYGGKEGTALFTGSGNASSLSAHGADGSGSVSTATGSTDSQRKLLRQGTKVGFRQSARTALSLLAVREDAAFRRKMFGHARDLSVVGDADEQFTGWRRYWHKLLAPDGRVRKSWDLCFMLALLWVTIRVPFLLAFDEKPSPTAGVFDQAADVIFIVDILVMFRTITVDDGDLLSTPEAIAKKYVRGWFWLDLVASFPYALVMPPELWNTANLLRLLRLLRITRIEVAERHISDLADLSIRQSVVMRMFKLFFYISVTGHVSACVWFYIARVEDLETSWPIEYKIADEDGTAETKTAYISAMYWAFTTLTTVGYGDVSAHTDAERLFSIGMILLGAVVFAMIVGKMSALSRELSERATERRHHQFTINQFLRFHSLPKTLRQRTRKFYQGLGHLHPFHPDTKLLGDMSSSLRRDVKLEQYARVIEAVPIFALGDFGLQCMVAKMLAPTLATPGEWIVIVGEVVDEMYFVLNGRVQIVDAEGFVITVLESGNSFNEVPVLDGKAAMVSARAFKTNVELYTLTRSDVQRILVHWPDFETSLRAIHDIGHAVHASAAGAQREHVPAPFGRNSWAELGEQLRFAKYLDVMTSRSRTIQATQFRAKPQDLSKVKLPAELDARVLTFLAKNSHHVWAFDKMHDGWVYGPVRDSRIKQHPNLVEWGLLSQQQRDWYKLVCRDVLRYLVRSGWHFVMEDSDKLDEALAWTFSVDSVDSAIAEAVSPRVTVIPDGSEAELEALLSEAGTDKQGSDPSESKADVSSAGAWQPLPFYDPYVAVDQRLEAELPVLAENSHALWAKRMQESGWKWAAHFSAEQKRHPSLLPFKFLQDDKRLMWRSSVVHTLRTVVAIGFQLAHGDAELAALRPFPGPVASVSRTQSGRLRASVASVRGMVKMGKFGASLSALPTSALREMGRSPGYRDGPATPSSVGTAAARESATAGFSGDVSAVDAIARLEQRVGGIESSLAAIARALNVALPRPATDG